jgi:hypothetical protein
MSNWRDNGGPAFPQNDLSSYGMGPAECSNGGMTLRDWFAGQALVGLLANERINASDGAYTPKMAAEDAYTTADAMLGARK